MQQKLSLCHISFGSVGTDALLVVSVLVLLELMAAFKVLLWSFLCKLIGME
jgi:hypothetical protein